MVWNPKHKYGAIPTKIDNIRFDSKLESNVYLALKQLEREEKLRMILRQVRFDLPGGARHAIDFAVFTEENVLFIEAKGKDLRDGKMRRRQVEDLYGVKVHVVKKVCELDEVLTCYGN